MQKNEEAWAEIKEAAISLQGSNARFIYCTHLGMLHARPAAVGEHTNPDVVIVALNCVSHVA